MSRVGIVAALVAEASAISSATEHCGVPLTLQDGTLLIVSGIGNAAAASAALALVGAGAAALASFGLAGGLDPRLRAGHILLPKQVIMEPDMTFTTSGAWRQRMGLALAHYQPILEGALLTSPGAIAAVEAKAIAFQQTGALAVDMESGGVAQIAASHGLPFLAARVIVDTAIDALPNAVGAASESGQVRIWRLIGALATTPGDLIAVIRLAYRYRSAMRGLRVVGTTGALREALT